MIYGTPGRGCGGGYCYGSGGVVVTMVVMDNKNSHRGRVGGVGGRRTNDIDIRIYGDKYL
jgi:hypothetical protein